MAPVSAEAARAREADDATRGSAIKLGAEVASRLLGLATTLLLLRGLGASAFGAFSILQVCALLLAELGELGLSNLASRALVAGEISLRSFLRARLVSLTLAGVAALTAIPASSWIAGQLGLAPVDGLSLALLVGWFALSGWGEFLGLALRCRRARRLEALLLLALRAAALLFAAAALLAGGGLRGVCAGLAVSPLPALVLGGFMLRRTAGPMQAPASGPASVLRRSAPLAVHGGLLLLSPRVEFLVLSLLRGQLECGLFAAGLNVIWFLSMVPSAIAAGAMPALTREALQGDGGVRRRTAATLGLLAAPAAVGLALLASPVARLLLGGGYTAAQYAASAVPLRILAAALPAIFLNALLAAALIAAGRAPWLPRLTSARVALAFVLAFVLVPSLGGTGAAAGLVLAEWLLLAGGVVTCRRAGFAMPVAPALAWGLALCLPMALAVSGLRDALPLALLVGALSWTATLAALVALAPGLLRQLLGDLRYP